MKYQITIGILYRLALCVLISHASAESSVFVLCARSALFIIPLFCMYRASVLLFDKRTAAIAAWIVACFPVDVLFVPPLLAESIFLMFFPCALLAIAHSLANNNAKSLAYAAALLAVSVAVKPTIYLFPAAIVVYVIVFFSRRVVHAASFVIVFCASIIPLLTAGKYGMLGSGEQTIIGTGPLAVIIDIAFCAILFLSVAGWITLIRRRRFKIAVRINVFSALVPYRRYKLAVFYLCGAGSLGAGAWCSPDVFVPLVLLILPLSAWGIGAVCTPREAGTATTLLMEKTRDISKAFSQFQSWADETVRRNGTKHYALEECRGWTPPWFGIDLGVGAWHLPTERNGKKKLNYHPFVIQQIYEEMQAFFKVLVGNNMLDNMLEIGLGDFGGTSVLFSQIFNSVTRVEFRDVVFNRYIAANEGLEILHNNTIIIADSRGIDITKLPTKDFDFLFIDGDHSYECARLDYEKYSPLVKKGGIVGFHDSRLKHLGSAQFVDSLRGRFDIKDIWHDAAYGGGISYYKV